VTEKRPAWGDDVMLFPMSDGPRLNETVVDDDDPRMIVGHRLSVSR
jgi:hypothetical protein